MSWVDDVLETLTDNIPIVGGVVSAALGLDAANNASDASQQVAANSTQLEKDKFEEAKRQADLLRQKGDEAGAIRIEEAAKADAGAAKKDAAAYEIYNQIQQRAADRQRAGDNIVDALKKAKDDVMAAAGLSAQQINDAVSKAQMGMKTAFDNTAARFSPFITSEKNAIGQLDAEMGLTSGTQYKGYQNTPAYLAAQDASRVAEQEGKQTIDTAAGNTGTLYSGTRGAALVDRAKQGSYERAQLEQSYYQNYMNMLQQMANPTSTTYLSNAEQQTARDSGNLGVDAAKTIAGINMNAAGTGLNATLAGGQTYLNSMRTGAEGQDLINYMDTGTAGSGLRIGAADTALNTQATAGGLITGNMPTGQVANNAIMVGAEAQNAALADVGGAITSGVSNYLKYSTPTNGSYNYAPNPYSDPYLYQPQPTVQATSRTAGIG